MGTQVVPPAVADVSAHRAPDDWERLDLVALVEYLNREQRTALQRATSRLTRLAADLDDGEQRTKEVCALASRFEVALAEHMKRVEAAAFARVVALERARLGTGPWPDPGEGPLHRQLASLSVSYRQLAGALGELREAASLLAPAAVPLHRALREVVEEFNRRLELEHGVLEPRALILEPASVSAPSD